MLGPVLAGTWLLAAPLLGTQDDEEPRRAFAALSPAERRAVAERFAEQAAALDTFQNELLRRARALGRDPESYPKARPYPYYDPRRHAPELAIARKRLKADGAAARAVHATLLARVDARRLRTAWRYDWGTRQVVRSGDPKDPRHVFENGLLGYPPGADLGEALVEAFLDEGRHAKELAAFGHAYTDRDGGVYPLTLYDAWCSGETIEMPDIDNLGIVHDLLDDWTTWVSPVPESRQKSLYRRVGRLFDAPHRYRALRTALARAYLTGEADMRDGYGPRLDHLHGFWHRHESSLERGRAALPGPADEEFFIADWGLAVEEDEALRAAAARRHLDLQRDARQLRELLIRSVQEAAAASEPDDDGDPGDG